jgi:hypothetical protein
MRNTGRHNKMLLYRHEIWKYSNLTFKQGYDLPYINIFIKFHTIYRLLATYLIVFAVVVVYWSFPLLNDNNQTCKLCGT